MKVYFAHPAFNDEQKAFKAAFLGKLRQQLGTTASGHAISVVDPFDHAPNVEHSIEEKVRMSRKIQAACLDLLEQCAVIIALVDWNDTGTAFEVGYAHRANMPVVLISAAACASANAMLLGTAHATFDNVLEQAQVEKLAGLLVTPLPEACSHRVPEAPTARPVPFRNSQK